MMKLALMLLMLAALPAPSAHAQQAQETSVARAQHSPKQQPLPPSMEWMNIASFIIGVLGVVGTVYTIRGWRRSEQDRKTLQYLFQTAEKNLQKDITEAEIHQKKQEASKIATEIHDLQQQLRESIPIEARRAVLLDKLFSQESLVSQTYSSVQEIRKELGPDAPPSQITPELAKIIERDIRPEYVLREERSHFKNQLTIITTAVAILSAILPDPIGPLISIPLFLLAAPVLVKLYKSYLPKDPTGRKLYTCRITYIGSFLGVIGTLLYPASLSMKGTPLDRMELHFGIAFAMAILFLFCGLFFFVRSRHLARSIGDRDTTDAHPNE
jgi:hypothetical protein